VPEVDKLDQAAVVFISTEIGRGHPGYLDGLVEKMRSDYAHITFHKSDVFTLSRGIPLAAWKAVRRTYRIGARGGIVSSVYGRLRRSTGSASGGDRLLKILGRDLRRRLSDFTGVIVAAHPIVARILAPYHAVIYQHGEMAAPPEAFVTGCQKILVPLRETAEHFFNAGYTDNDIMVTGQCIESDLIRQAPEALEERMSRLAADRPLTAALFSSGAYPKDHLAILREAAISLVNAGHTVYIFAGLSKRIADEFARHFRLLRTTGDIEFAAFERIHIVHAQNRADENRQVAEIFARLDLFIAPAHERTNWAVGLGLPQIILTPHIGSYAPLNAKLALSREVAAEIDSSTGRSVPIQIEDLRRGGRLSAMAENGFGRTNIDGFAQAVRFIAGCCKAKK
jgi:hypothetical protein